MEKLRIAIPGREEDVVYYVKTMEELGAEPQVRPEKFEADGYDALIIPGGEDIDPARYGQENTGCRKIDPEMDELQFDALSKFLAAGKPVLGVCNGMQMINIYFGGDLIQDIESNYRHQTNQGVVSFHESRIMKDSWLYELYGENAYINSSHHQAVGKVGKGLIVQQYSDDDVIESIRHESLPVFGVQWHPERMWEGHYPAPAVDGWKVYARFLKAVEENKKC